MASARTTPAPDKMTGNFAFDKSDAASAIAVAPPEGLSNSMIDGNSISIT